MQLELKDLQFFYLAVIGFAFIGLRRGWRRELFSLVFALSGVVFLFFGLGQFLAQFFFLRLPAIVQLGATGAVDNKPASAYTLPANDGRILFTTVLTFIIIVIAGYLIGNKAFPKPATAQERILGVIPSVIAGFVLVAYLTNFAKNQITLAI